ncbi:hypothetical protein [Rhizobium leguminosarum]|uniref:hypothetical protein n=1 Tax=Rhizobium leguminosarum TaxID=384 RepID=UPI000518C787
MAKVSGLCLPPPSSDHQADGAGALGSKLEPPRHHHRKPNHLSDHSPKAAKTQRLLEAFQDELLLDRFDIDHTIRMEADLGQGRCEEVGSSEAPNDLAFGSGSNPSGEQRCGRSVDSSGSATGKFVNRTIGQPATGKPLIDLANTKWQDRFRASHGPFKVLYAISKIGNDAVCAGLRHSEPSSKSSFHLTRKRVCSLFVLSGNVSQCTYAGECSANCNLSTCC